MRVEQLECISFDEMKSQKDKASFIKAFLSLPKDIYPMDELTQNKREERAILEKKHFLSGYFDVMPYIVTGNKKILARCMVAYYPDKDKTYIGYFECKNDYQICKFLLDRVFDDIKKNGRLSLTGPVNCSFWLGYRFRTTQGGVPFTGEPYNKPYYPVFFEKYGFKVTDRYVSGKVAHVTNDIYRPKGPQRLKEMQERNLEFKTLDIKNYDSQVAGMHDLAMTLFKNFATFHEISKSEFCNIFAPLKSIVNPDMVQMAYHGKKLVGFITVLPNLQNLPYRTGIFSLLKLCYLRRHPKEYVVLYMGVDKEYLGLGPAMLEIIRQKLLKTGQGAIAALVHDKKITGCYFSQYYDEEYDYVLLKKTIS